MTVRLVAVLAGGAALAIGAALGSTARAWSEAEGERDPRYALHLAVEPGSGGPTAPHTLRVRADARAGWHFAEEAPATLTFSAPDGVDISPLRQRREDAVRHGEDRIEFRAEATGSGTATGRPTTADGQLKLGLCADGNDRCVIVRRAFAIELAPR